MSAARILDRHASAEARARCACITRWGKDIIGRVDDWWWSSPGYIDLFIPLLWAPMPALLKDRIDTTVERAAMPVLKEPVPSPG